MTMLAQLTTYLKQAIAETEINLGKRLQWLICLKHCNELQLLGQEASVVVKLAIIFTYLFFILFLRLLLFTHFG